MATAAGYSDAPLAKKLGFKEGYRVRISHAPKNYLKLVSPHPTPILISKAIRTDIDIWHFFTDSALQLRQELSKNARRNQSRRYDLGVLAEESLESRY